MNVLLTAMSDSPDTVEDSMVNASQDTAVEQSNDLKSCINKQILQDEATVAIFAHIESLQKAVSKLTEEHDTL